MPFISIYLHCVWSTKNRIPLLSTPEIRSEMWNHIYSNALSKKIQLDFINGYKDHCHCLISLLPDQNISKIIQLIKGESSHWLNKTGMIKESFSWQHDYYVASVSPKDVLTVRNYIENQELHHRRVTWEEEYNELVSSVLPPARAGG